MEYGILIAVSEEGEFQIIGAVSSKDEAQEMADGYLKYRPETDSVVPDRFEIHRRGRGGLYQRIEKLESENKCRKVA